MRCVSNGCGHVCRYDKCGPGSFPCNNSSVCLPLRFNCDGVEDCPGGEDENLQTCNDIFGFKYMNNLLEREVSSTPHPPEECDVTNVPVGCRCIHRTRIFCKSLGVKRLPSNMSSNVRRLIAKNNSIDYIGVDTLQNYTELEILHLEANFISYVPPGVFASQSKLSKLYLGQNRLRVLEMGVFSNLTSLLWLHLDENELVSIDLDDLQDLQNMLVLNLSKNALTFKDQAFPLLTSLKVLDLRINSMEEVNDELFAGLKDLVDLILCRNKIRFIHPNAFYNLTRLDTLDLTFNQLTVLPTGMLRSQGVLTRLGLGRNPLQRLAAQLFTNLKNLSSLNVEDIDISVIDPGVFSSVKSLSNLYLSSFHLCAYAPRVRMCHPRTDGVSSVEHLLDKPLLRVTVWLVAATAGVGNTLVLWGRFSSRDDNRVLSFVVRNLAVSDLLMGVYLFIIAIQDAQFRNIYNQVAKIWITSWACTFIGVVAMTSCEVSVLILVFLSVERFLLISVPFSAPRSLTLKTASVAMAAIWTAGFTLAVIPVIHWRDSNRFYGSNGLCFPLHIDGPFLLGWQYSTFIFLGINLCGLVLLVLLYSGMFVSVWRTRHATPMPVVRDREFMVRFFFIVLTDAGCWAPLIVIKFMAMFGTPISADLYAWLVVFILPVNSAVNPLLYTFTTPRYRGQLLSLARSKKPPSVAETEFSRTSSRNTVACATAKNRAQDFLL